MAHWKPISSQPPANIHLLHILYICVYVGQEVTGSRSTVMLNRGNLVSQLVGRVSYTPTPGPHRLTLQCLTVSYSPVFTFFFFL